MKRSSKLRNFNKTVNISAANITSMNFSKVNFNDLVDVVELKWSICPESFSKMIQIAKQDDDVVISKWNTYIYDTQSFELNKNKVVLRVREYESYFRSSLKQIFTLDKYNNKSIRNSVNSFDCQGDYTGNRESIGCSIVNTEKNIQNVFSEEQKNVLKNLVNLSVTNLKAFGPTKTTRITFKKKSIHDEKLVVEIYETRTGVTFVELSTRNKSNNFLEVYKLISHWLLKNQINVCPVSKSKPQLIMEEELKFLN